MSNPDHHPTAENLDSLYKIKKFNDKIWIDLIQSSNEDPKMQGIESCVLKAIGAISYIPNMVFDLKTNGDQNVTDT